MSLQSCQILAKLASVAGTIERLFFFFFFFLIRIGLIVTRAGDVRRAQTTCAHWLELKLLTTCPTMQLLHAFIGWSLYVKSKLSEITCSDM